MKIVWSEADKAEEVFEISGYYTEMDYVEAARGKDSSNAENEIILNNGQVWTMTAESAEEGDDAWEQVIIMSDTGFELFKAEKVNE